MVAGNHEFISGIERSEAFLAQTKITLLRDSVVTLPCGLQIIGRDDRSNRHRKGVEELLAEADDSKPTLLLDHQPYELAKNDSLKVDIQFSGHTHRGQVWPLSLLVDSMYEQSHGYRKWNHSHIYVSSGLSLWGPPFRIGTSSDMAVFNISGSNSAQ
jgi:predicted MPP superfamily phosphohydrolase